MVVHPTAMNLAGTLVAGRPAVIAVASLPTAPAEAGALDAMIEGTSLILTLHSKITFLRHKSHSGREGGGLNPGNNLHVSGLSHKVDTRDLEQTFAKIGRVRLYFICVSGDGRELLTTNFISGQKGVRHV